VSVIWAESDPGLEAARMELLRLVRDWEPRFRLLFPHPTPADPPGGGRAGLLLAPRRQNDLSTPAARSAALIRGAGVHCRAS
jgi:hypothetical protein